jgi:hypothetical protein
VSKALAHWSIMNEVRIKSFEEFHKAFDKYRNDNRWVFRGHGETSWELKPKAGRKPYSNRNDLEYF